MRKRNLVPLAASSWLACALLSLGGTSVAQATGTTRIQHRFGDATDYRNVRFTIDDHALTLTNTSDNDALTIALVGCVKAGELHRCRPGGAEYRRNGEVRALHLTSGTLYFNATGGERALPLSSARVPSHGVILALRTAQDTYVSATAKIDGLK